jgi:hypothetical protein
MYNLRRAQFVGNTTVLANRTERQSYVTSAENALNEGKPVVIRSGDRAILNWPYWEAVSMLAVYDYGLAVTNFVARGCSGAPRLPDDPVARDIFVRHGVFNKDAKFPCVAE